MLTRWLTAPRLPLYAASFGVLLSSPSLSAGFALDDYYHRLLLLSLPGAELVARSYVTLYAIANGVPEHNHWLAEQGYAPWWIDEHLLLAMFRPLSSLTHRLDYSLWPDSAWLMHAHNLLWFGLALFVLGLLFRRLLPPRAAGVAMLLYAVDHTHGFAVGWIANRNILVALAAGAAAMLCHVYWRRERRDQPLWGALAALLLLASLLAAEGALATFAYLLGFALFLDRGRLGARLASVAHYLVVVVGWRVVYDLLGYGARGSGLYIDPVREPLAFAGAVLERVPVLLVGQFAVPPAELYLMLPEHLAMAMQLGGYLLLLLLALGALPLLRSSAPARFFAFGMLCSLLPLCATHPNNRLLFFSGIGAMGLLAELLFAVPRLLRARPVVRAAGLAFVAVAGLVHVVGSPLALPLTSRLSTIGRVVDEVAVRTATEGVEIATKDLIVVSAPDYAYVNQIRFVRAVRGQPEPRRLRALAVGPVPLDVTRLDEDSLQVRFVGGLLATPLSQLYRSAEQSFQVGERVELDGMTAVVTEVTPDGRPLAVRYHFDTDLDSDRFRWIYWVAGRYTTFELPAPGERVSVPPAYSPFRVHGVDGGSHAAESLGRIGRGDRDAARVVQGAVESRWPASSPPGRALSHLHR